jgi:hypothetical protein
LLLHTGLRRFVSELDPIGGAKATRRAREYSRDDAPDDASASRSGRRNFGTTNLMGSALLPEARSPPKPIPVASLWDAARHA